MPTYEYKALTKAGRKTTGVQDASTLNDAKGRLREQGLMIISISEKKTGGKDLLKGDDLAGFMTLLGTLVGANVPLYESLVSLEEQYRGESFHGVVAGLCEKVKSGGSLSEAMREYPQSFDRMTSSMVAAGEASGALALVLERVGRHLTAQEKLKKSIVTAMIYPALLGVFAISVIGLLLLFVIPSLESLFEGRDLNVFTRFVLGISRIARGYLWIIVPIVVGSVTFCVFKLRTNRGRAWWQTQVLKIPLLRTMALRASLARYCRTMATLLEGGVTVIEALKIARDVMGNVVLEREVAQVEAGVIQGGSLTRELAACPHVPAMVSRMVGIGEESGTTPRMFHKAADIFEEELQKVLERIMALAQPAILAFVGVTIALIMLAILLPLTDIANISLGP